MQSAPRCSLKVFGNFTVNFRCLLVKLALRMRNRLAERLSLFSGTVVALLVSLDSLEVIELKILCLRVDVRKLGLKVYSLFFVCGRLSHLNLPLLLDRK